MSRRLICTSRSTIRKHEGSHRSAQLPALAEPVHLGMHGALLSFYREKYGSVVDRERPATLDYMVAAVGG
jgi:hypothetical protein